jgi:FAD/FMN-containing dehydrogenase
VGFERRHRSFDRELETLDAGAAKLGGTRNDALLAAVAGAARSSLDRVPPALRAFCPVNLRKRGDRVLGNRISMWILELPVQEPDLEARVRKVREATMRLKRGGDAAGGKLLERLAAGFGAWTARLGMALAARLRVYQIVITNVSGPARELTLLGARLTSLVPFAPLFPGQRVAVAAMTHAGRLHVGITDGFRTPEFGDRFASAIGRELADVAAHSDRTPPVLQRSA